MLGAGVALQYLSPRVTLLIFAAAVALGILAAAPLPGPAAALSRACQGTGCRAGEGLAQARRPRQRVNVVHALPK